MKKYVLKRTVWLIITVIVAFVVAFFVYTQLVGNILDLDSITLHKISRNIPEIKRRYDLGQPKYVRLINFIKRMFTNKLEYYTVYIKNGPIYVMPVIIQKVKMNLIFIFSVMIFGSAVSVPLGIRLSREKSSKVLNLMMYLGMSIPTYLLAKVIFLKFMESGFYCNYMAHHSVDEVTGLSITLKDYIMPFIALSVMYISQCTKRIKSEIPSIMKKEFIMTAYAYGFGRRKVEYKYALKNALVPIITFIGSSFSLLFSELIVIQTALNSDGLGGFFLSMVNARQYDAVFACVAFIITIVAIFNYIVDLLYFVVDPRIKVR